eukprot:m.143122 g.143122  ORF g.143122 m.143122 type:complete len:775 (+) comp24205_c1_seq3:79-2403(+)
MADKPQFKLSSVLGGHTAEIRGVNTTDSGDLLSCARDNSAKLWKKNDGTYSCAQTFTGHSRYVLSIAYMSPTPEFPSGLVITGSLDQNINVYDPALDNPIRQLVGHTNAVCCVTVDGDRILSSSWDHTARVWKDFACVRTLKGHELPVQCIVANRESNLLLTGSSDKTIRLWNETACISTLSGHNDAVRGLAILSDSLFASASNDCNIKLWSFHGECLGTLSGHAGFVYSICPMAGGEFATTSEDGTMRVWRDQEPVQTIAMPYADVWSVAYSPITSDLVVGGGDGSVYVFTRFEDRVADEETTAHFNQAVVAHQSLQNIDQSKIEGPEALNSPGTKDGDIKMIKEGSKVMAYVWVAEQFQWTCQGEVTGAKPDNPDEFKFSIELDGKTWTITHNKAENPYVTAQKFIHNNELGQHYLDDIAKFISQNCQTPTLQYGAQPQSQPDPFTGGNSYVPGMSGNTTGAFNNVDPFTGGSAYSTQPATTAQPQQATPMSLTSNLFPNKTSVWFDTGNIAGMLKKLREINATVPEASRVDENSLQTLETFLSKDRSSAASDGEILILAKTVSLLLSWPVAELDLKVFVGLDILRLLLCFSSVQEALTAKPALFEVDIPLFLLQHAGLSGEVAYSAPNQMLALRSLANALACPKLVDSCSTQILESLAACPVAALNKNCLIAHSTIVLNFEVLFYSRDKDSDFDLYTLCLQVLDKVLALDTQHDEAIFRALMAFGSLLVKDDNVKALAISIPSLLTSAQKWAGKGSPKVQSTAAEVVKLLR